MSSSANNNFDLGGAFYLQSILQFWNRHLTWQVKICEDNLINILS